MAENQNPTINIADIFGESACALCGDVRHIPVDDPVDADITTIPCPSCSGDYPTGAEVLGTRCIDGGTCHHDCKTRCFRRECCTHFSDYKGPWAYPKELPDPPARPLEGKMQELTDEERQRQDEFMSQFIDPRKD